MNNVIIAQINFSFKGQNLSPSATIDLDNSMQTHGSIPNLTQLLARENQIDVYSYEYEVMEITPVIITTAQGMVNQYINAEKQLDIKAFEKWWHKDNVLIKLQDIAKSRLEVVNLDKNEALKLALLDAYTVGKNDGSGSSD